MIIAVDTGGTKTLVTLFSDKGQLEKKRRFETPMSIPTYIRQLRETIGALSKNHAIKAISIALPGRIDSNDVLVGAGNLPWRNVDIKALLTPHFKVPIFVQNDANLAGLGETRLLKSTPAVSLYVTFSTGVGTGITLNGRLDPALNRTEGGQAMVEYDGAIRRWEDIASGKAIVEIYGKRASEITSERTWHQIADRMSRGLLAQIPLLQPDVVIIGGAVGTHFGKYGDILQKLLDERLHKSLVIRPKFLQAAHPQEAVVYGCYYYALDRLAA